MENRSEDIGSLFNEVCGEYLREHECFETRGELGVFSHAAVVWLGIQQRLTDNTLQSSLSTLIDRIRSDNDPVSLVTRPGKKIRSGEISLNTGGVSRARERMPTTMATELLNAATTNIRKRLKDTDNIYLLDGEVLTVSRTDSVLKHFGKTGNGEGELHFPRMRVVAAHSLQTGVATSISAGTWHDSEVKLGAEVLTQLPRGSTVIMDRFFDKPTFLAKASELELSVVVRIRDMVAKRLLGGIPTSAQCEKEVIWTPADKKLKHIALKGRVIKFSAAQSGFRSSVFYFFTTSNRPLTEIAALYRQRVKIETFIRQLKQTLKLFFIRAKKAGNVRKEISIAYLTFNLLRAIMYLAAKDLGIEPERVSFTATVTLCNAYASGFLTAKSNADKRDLYARFLAHIAQTKIPKRNKERSYPRVVKFPRDKYPKRGIVKDYSLKEGK